MCQFCNPQQIGVAPYTDANGSTLSNDRFQLTILTN